MPEYNEAALITAFKKHNLGSYATMSKIEDDDALLQALFEHSDKLHRLRDTVIEVHPDLKEFRKTVYAAWEEARQMHEEYYRELIANRAKAAKDAEDELLRLQGWTSKEDQVYGTIARAKEIIARSQRSKQKAQFPTKQEKNLPPRTTTAVHQRIDRTTGIDSNRRDDSMFQGDECGTQLNYTSLEDNGRGRTMTSRKGRRSLSARVRGAAHEVATKIKNEIRRRSMSRHRCPRAQHSDNTSVVTLAFEK